MGVNTKLGNNQWADPSDNKPAYIRITLRVTSEFFGGWRKFVNNDVIPDEDGRHNVKNSKSSSL